MKGLSSFISTIEIIVAFGIVEDSIRSAGLDNEEFEPFFRECAKEAIELSSATSFRS